jgi:hypothetical protein
MRKGAGLVGRRLARETSGEANRTVFCVISGSGG